MSNIQVISKTQKIFADSELLNESVGIDIVSRTQRIVVLPNASISIINAGPIGPSGPKGLQGPEGPQGPPGVDIGATSYTHVQNVPSDEWVINHNLLFRPAGISVQDTGGSNVEGEIIYVSGSVIMIKFSAIFAGICYLS